jgi:protein-L-isoaspartate(D-aspartate) O-methyltransferase
MNVEQARSQMLGQQIRAWEVLDGRVLDVLRETARELFVPQAYRELAFADMEIPLAHDQRMLTPKIEGRLLQALCLQSSDCVLEIGSGSGYLTACLAKLATSVVSVDIFSDFSTDAASKTEQLKINNVEFRTEDALTMRNLERFDAIAITGSVPEVDDRFIKMLRPGGRLFVFAGRAPVMEAQVITLHETGGYSTDSLFESVVGPLINAEHPEPFVL